MIETTAASSSDTIGGEMYRYIFAVRPKCKRCGGYEFRIHASHEQGDGSRLQEATCKACSTTAKIVWDDPDV